MVSSSAGKTRGSWFPSEDYATEIEGLPSTLDAVRGVRWNPNDKGAKELADKGIAGPTPTRPVYCVSKALLNKVPFQRPLPPDSSLIPPSQSCTHNHLPPSQIPGLHLNSPGANVSSPQFIHLVTQAVAYPGSTGRTMKEADSRGS